VVIGVVTTNDLLASIIIEQEACLRCAYGSTLSPVMAGRLPCGNNVVLALDSQALYTYINLRLRRAMD